MRTEKALKNSISAIILTIVTIILGFLSQKIFILTLGTEYLGINGLFSNIVSMMAIVELGIGPAIIYNLYKAVAENDIKQIKILLNFYRKAYHFIAIIILLLGVGILPFVSKLVGEINIEYSIHLLFIMFVVDVVFSYLLTYKRSLLLANQRSSVINYVHLTVNVLVTVLQIVVLLYIQNYIVYLGLKIISRLIENIIINKFVEEEYSYVKEPVTEILDEDTKQDIINKVKGLLLHKVGGIIVQGTDNVLLAYFAGIRSVALYSNYYMIINALNIIVSQIFGSIVASVGNLLIEADDKRSQESYSLINFINHAIAVICCSCLLVLIQPFIGLWLGTEYCMNLNIVVALVVSLYLTLMRKCPSTFKEAAGVYHEDRYVPVIESCINLVSSLVLMHYWGVIGVFLGTITSTLFLHIYSYPKYVYEATLGMKKNEYLKRFTIESIQAVIIMVLVYYVTGFVKIENLFLNFIVKGISTVSVSGFIMWMIYRGSVEYEKTQKIVTQFVKKGER